LRNSGSHEMFDAPPREKCGVFGVFGHERAASVTYYGLYSLQHRGEESAGVVVSDGTDLRLHRKMGLVAQLDFAGLERLRGYAAIGHVRYSTTGSSVLNNAQPLFATSSAGPLAVAHNGNLVNAAELRRDLESQGSIFQTTSDSEIIIHLLARPEYRESADGLERSLARLEGAFSFLILTPKALYAARDWFGIRPLSIGRLGGAWVVSSESCAYDLIGAEFMRDVEPGEVVRIDESGISSSRIASPPPDRRAYCIFEHVYFARPDSRLFGRMVYTTRCRAGEILAREHPVEADLVVPVPDSGVFAALGYSHASGIPFHMGFIRNHYVGRTFILPDQSDRDFRVRIKLNVIRDIVKGKRVVVVDDSIIRGTTTRSRVNLLRKAGATEVHMRIACPPTRHACYYGIDFPDPATLIANRHEIPEIARIIDADSLGYLSLEGLLEAVGGDRKTFCTACFSGEYPVLPRTPFAKNILERE